MAETPRLLAVLDFEATCADAEASPAWRIEEQEIIELPVALVSVAERRVVGRFGTFVRPVLQPELTAFCTGLTTIRQEDVAGAPVIQDAIARLSEWLDAEGARAEHTLVVTCGDWDLRRMWPTQASLWPDLPTPPIFRRWCNLKTVFQARGYGRGGSMMEMLRRLELPHVGTHHRGADDVENLARVVVKLLEAGAEPASGARSEAQPSGDRRPGSSRPIPGAFDVTWGPREQAKERATFAAKLREAEAAVLADESALDALPAHVPAAAREAIEGRLSARRKAAERLARRVAVFE